eukprot:832920-Amphidinium_carterae.1
MAKPAGLTTIDLRSILGRSELCVHLPCMAEIDHSIVMWHVDAASNQLAPQGFQCDGNDSDTVDVKRLEDVAWEEWLSRCHP